MAHEHGYISRKDDYLKRLRRIEGQARGLQRMVDEEKYCIDILTQVSAMTKALHAVSIGLLEDHMNHCVVDAARAGDDGGPREGRRGRRGDRPAGALLMSRPQPDLRRHPCHRHRHDLRPLRRLGLRGDQRAGRRRGRRGRPRDREVTITSGAPLDPADVEAAVAEAGYAA